MSQTLESRQISRHEFTLNAKDGFALSATLFTGNSESKTLVIIASATGVLRESYSKIAHYLAKQDMPVLTFDYRGIGGSSPRKLRGFRAYMHEWGTLDLSAVLQWSKTKLKPRQIFLLGHSVAGQIFPLAENNHLVDAAYFVAAQSGYWKLWPGIDRLKIFLFWYLVIPVAIGVTGYLPGWTLGNAQPLPAVIARQWAKWGRHPDYILSSAPDIREKFAKIKIPLKFICIPNDLFAPEQAVKEIAKWYGSANKTIQVLTRQEFGVDSIGHFGFFRERFKETLWHDVLSWFHLHI